MQKGESMKKLRMVALSFILLTIGSAALACSISYNETHIKNILISQTANHFNLDLTKAYQLKAEYFLFQILSEDPVTLCPIQVQSSADITIRYRQSINTVCELTVHTIETSYWAPTSYPFRQYRYYTPASSCRLIHLPYPPQPRPPRRP